MPSARPARVVSSRRRLPLRLRLHARCRRLPRLGPAALRANRSTQAEPDTGLTRAEYRPRSGLPSGGQGALPPRPPQGGVAPLTRTFCPPRGPGRKGAQLGRNTALASPYSRSPITPACGGRLARVQTGRSAAPPPRRSRRERRSGKGGASSPRSRGIATRRERGPRPRPQTLKRADTRPPDPPGQKATRTTRTEHPRQKTGTGRPHTDIRRGSGSTLLRDHPWRRTLRGLRIS